MRHGFSRRFPEARLDKNRHQIQEPGEPPSYRTVSLSCIDVPRTA